MIVYAIKFDNNYYSSSNQKWGDISDALFYKDYNELKERINYAEKYKFNNYFGYGKIVKVKIEEMEE